MRLGTLLISSQRFSSILSLLDTIYEYHMSFEMILDKRERELPQHVLIFVNTEMFNGLGMSCDNIRAILDPEAQ